MEIEGKFNIELFIWQSIVYILLALLVYFVYKIY